MVRRRIGRWKKENDKGEEEEKESDKEDNGIKGRKKGRIERSGIDKRRKEEELINDRVKRNWQRSEERIEKGMTKK